MKFPTPHRKLGEWQKGESDMSQQTDLTVLPMKHFWWHKWSLYAAHAFVWIGFWIAAFRALTEDDGGLLIVALMLLGIGLLIFRGVVFFMNVWVLLASYISAREIREAEEIRNVEETL